MHGCSVTGHGQLLILTATVIYGLGHGLRTLSAVPRSTQPSTLRGIVKWVSAFGLSNNNKQQRWTWMVAAIYRQTRNPSRLTWSKGWQPPSDQSAFIVWTLTMALVTMTAPLSWHYYLLLLFSCRVYSELISQRTHISHHLDSFSRSAELTSTHRKSAFDVDENIDVTTCHITSQMRTNRTRVHRAMQRHDDERAQMFSDIYNTTSTFMPVKLSSDSQRSPMTCGIAAYDIMIRQKVHTSTKMVTVDSRVYCMDPSKKISEKTTKSKESDWYWTYLQTQYGDGAGNIAE